MSDLLPEQYAAIDEALARHFPGRNVKLRREPLCLRGAIVLNGILETVYVSCSSFNNKPYELRARFANISSFELKYDRFESLVRAILKYAWPDIPRSEHTLDELALLALKALRSKATKRDMRLVAAKYLAEAHLRIERHGEDGWTWTRWVDTKMQPPLTPREVQRRQSSKLIQLAELKVVRRRCNKLVQLAELLEQEKGFWICAPWKAYLQADERDQDHFDFRYEMLLREEKDDADDGDDGSGGDGGGGDNSGERASVVIPFKRELRA